MQTSKKHNNENTFPYIYLSLIHFIKREKMAIIFIDKVQKGKDPYLITNFK